MNIYIDRKAAESWFWTTEGRSVPFCHWNMARIRLLVSDFVMSFMWVWSGVLVKMFVNKYLAFSNQLVAEVVVYALLIVNMFFFAFLGDITKGGAYNPLTVFGGAITGDFSNFLFTVGARIPAQVVGSITGVRYLIETFPEIRRGPRLSVDIHRGALTEGLLTFCVVTTSLVLSRKIPGNSHMKTWISSVSKLTLHILGSDLTGGCMNPASVMGWAYARGEHITKEHLFVYWLGPIKATILAVLMFKLIFGPVKEEKSTKSKSE